MFICYVVVCIVCGYFVCGFDMVVVCLLFLGLFRVLLLRVKVFDNGVDWFFVSLDGLITVLNYGGCLL